MGMIYNVLVVVGNLVGKTNMMVIPLKDFDLILTHASLGWCNGDVSPCFV